MFIPAWLVVIGILCIPGALEIAVCLGGLIGLALIALIPLVLTAFIFLHQ